MNLIHQNHEGHVITNRYSGPWCDTCVGPIQHDAEWCQECWGTGTKRRMASIYNGPGKTYRCGMCKGSGKREAIPCVECQAPGVIYTAQINSKPSHYCSACYTEKVGA